MINIYLGIIKITIYDNHDMKEYEELDWINSCLTDGTIVCQWFGSRDYLYMYSLRKELNDVLMRAFMWLKSIHHNFHCKLIPQIITIPEKNQRIKSMSVIINTPTPHYSLCHHKDAPPQDPVFMKYLVEKCPLWIIYADAASM